MNTMVLASTGQHWPASPGFADVVVRRSVRTIERYRQDYSCLLEITPGLKNLIDDPLKSTELRIIARKVCTKFACISCIFDYVLR